MSTRMSASVAAAAGASGNPFERMHKVMTAMLKEGEVEARKEKEALYIAYEDAEERAAEVRAQLSTARASQKQLARENEALRAQVAELKAVVEKKGQELIKRNQEAFMLLAAGKQTEDHLRARLRDAEKRLEARAKIIVEGKRPRTGSVDSGETCDLDDDSDDSASTASSEVELMEKAVCPHCGEAPMGDADHRMCIVLGNFSSANAWRKCCNQMAVAAENASDDDS